MLKGIGASDGIGIGRALVIKEQKISYKKRLISDTDAEFKRLKKAIDDFVAKTNVLADKISVSAGEKEAEILKSQVLIIQDPSMTDEIKKHIKSGECAESAVENVCDMFIDILSEVDDELTRQRTTDIRDLKNGLLKVLLGVESIDIGLVPPNTIICAEDLTPSMTAGMDKKNVVGIITETGGVTSHSAILARALEIPAVLSVGNAVNLIKNGDNVIIDGANGEVSLNPSEDKQNEYVRKKEKYLKEKSELQKYIGHITKTADDIKVELVCNIGSTGETDSVIECDGEGIGLFRTEFLFMDRKQTPTEEEQFEVYKTVAVKMNGKPVIIRTLDVGGDKNIPYLELPKEENPFLGFRAVRYCLENRELYSAQLRALLRASAFGNIKIMIPMITCVEEIRKVKSLIHELEVGLDSENIAYNKNIPIGIMIETPSAAVEADLLAKEADFFSIGTNDLIQYTMAVDRGNSKVSYLYSAFNPSVLRLIKYVISCAKAENIMTGMCGEAAADKLLIPLLISFGLDEFSVGTGSVLSTRKEISMWTKKSADMIAEQVMKLSTANEVVEYLKAVLYK